MRELAQLSRVTVPTVYNLIGSREQVLFAAVEEQTHNFVANLKRSVGDVTAIVEATVGELLRMPRYYRSLLKLLLTSDVASPALRNVTRALGNQLRIALGELAEEGELVRWVDLDALRDRLQSHLWMTSLDWACFRISDERLRDVAVYEMSLLLLGVTHGTAHQEFERVARAAQSAKALHLTVVAAGEDVAGVRK